MSTVRVVADALIEMAKTADEQASDPHGDVQTLRAKLHACAAWLRYASEFLAKNQPAHEPIKPTIPSHQR